MDKSRKEETSGAVLSREEDERREKKLRTAVEVTREDAVFERGKL